MLLFVHVSRVQVRVATRVAPVTAPPPLTCGELHAVWAAWSAEDRAAAEAATPAPPMAAIMTPPKQSSSRKKPLGSGVGVGHHDMCHDNSSRRRQLSDLADGEGGASFTGLQQGAQYAVKTMLREPAGGGGIGGMGGGGGSSGFGGGLSAAASRLRRKGRERGRRRKALVAAVTARQRDAEQAEHVVWARAAVGEAGKAAVAAAVAVAAAGGTATVGGGRS